jgi:SAM-dependent methyltransferase
MGPLVCNICRWSGSEFEGGEHAEYQTCPQCGSNARDRFLFLCLTKCVAAPLGRAKLHVLENSPRLDRRYRKAMASWFEYIASDYDQRSHRTDRQIDLQQIHLPDSSLEVVLSAHVLEHVPDVDRALTELLRVLRPGGHLLLQVPVLHGMTAPAEKGEFHADTTPVFWHFGLDLTNRLVHRGFKAKVLCTQHFHDVIASGATNWPGFVSGEFDAPSILAAAAESNALQPICDTPTSIRLGLRPAYMLLAWNCVKQVI